MSKVIIKTALKTLLIVILVAAAAFAVASFGFPQHMATFFENTENYSIAAKYASLRYSYTNEVEDAARCASDAILSEDDSTIVKYCVKFTGHKDFESYCEQMDEYYSSTEYAQYTTSYKQYIYGKYVVALASGGTEEDKEEAAEQALSANGVHSFKSGNALSVLALWAVENGDGELCSIIVTKMSTISPSDDAEYYQSILQIVQNAAA